MKQMDTVQKRIGENTFYIRPFPALKAAVISGDLTKILGPVLGELGPAVEEAAGAEDFDLKTMSVEKALPAIGAALSHIDGDLLENLIRKLLISNANVSIETSQGSVSVLSEDTLNEVFCGELQDMLILCFEVIKLNYGDFFGKLAGRFGSLQGIIPATKASRNGEASTQAASLT